jgi:hypothetical protein
MTFLDQIIERLFGSRIQALVDARAETATVSVRVDDSPGWDSQTSAGPHDRRWSERADDLDDALEAWRKNFMVRRITSLIRSYVVGAGIQIGSSDPNVDAFVQAFWAHRQNQLARRLGPMCDELTRSGELFPVLHTNRVDGMSYVRFVPAARIRVIETAPNDYEIERRYRELGSPEDPEGRAWYGRGHWRAFKPTPKLRLMRPLMLHYSINKPIGATRGEGDLGPCLPWARRYSEWLADRVRLNRQRTRAGVLDIEIADDAVVEQKREQLRRTNPISAGIYVHGPGESVTLHNLQINAQDARDDGLALRLAVATGSNAALHYIGEGEAVNYATAKEMGEPTARFFAERQTEFCAMLVDLIKVAYRRKVALDLAPALEDLQLYTSVPEVARSDNLSLAQAANEITQALATLLDRGLIDRETAARLAFKFAGETHTDNEIDRILNNTEPVEPRQEEP